MLARRAVDIDWLWVLVWLWVKRRWSQEMLPSGKILTIIGLVSFCSNWQFGFQVLDSWLWCLLVNLISLQCTTTYIYNALAKPPQITYINTASRSFYQLADEIYDQNSPNIPSSDIPPAKNVSSSERWPHLPMHQWSEEWSTSKL